MTKFVLRIVCVAVIAGSIQPSGHSQEPKQVADLMRRKLEQAQKVLEGITLNDFDKISRGGEELMVISKAAEWKVVKTPQYDVHSNSFRRAVETLIQSARDKNLDGATLAYLDMTMSCVRCHKYVRDIRMARLDRPSVIP